MITTSSAEPEDQVRAVFYGLGATERWAPTKTPSRIIGDDTPKYAQGYFVYDSKKSGA